MKGYKEEDNMNTYQPKVTFIAPGNKTANSYGEYLMRLLN
jgi:hypothetical protein